MLEALQRSLPAGTDAVAMVLAEPCPVGPPETAETPAPTKSDDGPEGPGGGTPREGAPPGLGESPVYTSETCPCCAAGDEQPEGRSRYALVREPGESLRQAGRRWNREAAARAAEDRRAAADTAAPEAELIT